MGVRRVLDESEVGAFVIDKVLGQRRFTLLIEDLARVRMISVWAVTYPNIIEHMEHRQRGIHGFTYIRLIVSKLVDVRVRVIPPELLRPR
jgi:hypothetical protein